MYVAAFEMLPREILVKAQLDKVWHNLYLFEQEVN